MNDDNGYSNDDSKMVHGKLLKYMYIGYTTVTTIANSVVDIIISVPLEQLYFCFCRICPFKRKSDK